MANRMSSLQVYNLLYVVVCYNQIQTWDVFLTNYEFFTVHAEVSDLQ